MKSGKLFSGLLLGVLLLNLNACKKDDNKNTSTSCSTSVCSKPLATGETAGTTPSGIIGKHTLTYHQVNAGAPFADGDQAVIELTSDNKMVVTYKSKCVTISTPRQSSPVEVIFPDICQFNVSFAASASTNGGLNEVNVNEIGGTHQFYGQFR